MPGSLEDYVQRIFAVASNGLPNSPANPAQKQWALGVTKVFMKGSVKKLIQQTILDTMYENSTKIQTMYRGTVARKLFRRRLFARKVIQQAAYKYI